MFWQRLYVLGFVTPFVASTLHAQAVGLPSARPAAVTVDISTTITVSSRITVANVIAGGVNVQRLNAQGQGQSIIGELHDDGLPPDLVAGDGVYSGTIVLDEKQTGSVSIRVSAATKGSLLRLTSGPLSIDVLPPGIPTKPAVPDLSQSMVDPVTGDTIVGNEVLVCFTPTTNISTITTDATLVSARLIGRFSGLGNCYQFQLPTGSTPARVESAISLFQTLTEVLSAEPDTILELASTFPCLTCGTTSYNLLRLSIAQQIVSTSGGRAKMVAVLDTGIVSAALGSVAPQIIPGPNELSPTAAPIDGNGHGTMIAGIVAATSPLSPIYIVQVCTATRACPVASIVDGLEDAAVAGASVISMSFAGIPSFLGFPLLYQFGLEQNAILYASGRDDVLVAAAGNAGSDTPQYPAAFPQVLSVAATDNSDVQAIFGGGQASNFGSWVRIAAPGLGIPTNGFPDPTISKNCSGTSCSTPFVSGVAAMLRTVNPSWPARQVVQYLANTAESATPLGGNLAGIGRLSPVQFLDLQVTGPGSVTLQSQLPGSPVSCTSNSPCTYAFMGVSDLTLTANITSGSTVTWGGACLSAGTNTIVQLALTGDLACTATFTAQTPIDGSCGSANGQVLTSAPSSNLCASGTPSSVSGTGPWSWTCAGSHGGRTASCSASAPATNDFGLTISGATCQIVPYPGYSGFVTESITVSGSATGPGDSSGTAAAFWVCLGPCNSNAQILQHANCGGWTAGNGCQQDIGQPASITWQLNYFFGFYLFTIPGYAQNPTITMQMIEIHSPFQSVQRTIGVACQ